MSDAEADDIPLEKWALGMTPRDAQFVREFLVDLNATKAMERCGHARMNALGNANRTMKRPAIMKGIAAAMSERAEDLKITARTVVGEAFRCYLGAVADRNWNAAGKFLEMVGRHVDVKAFRDHRGIGDDTDEATGLENLSNEELEQLDRLTRKMSGESGDQATPPRLN